MTCAVVAAYSNSFRGPFVFDDTVAVLDNPSILRLADWRTVLWPPPSGVTVAGRPLLNLSLALNHAAGGFDVTGYHLVNLLIHLAATYALFGLVRRSLLLPAAPPALSSAALPLAGAVALLWALHPLQTESVTYVVQRAESMVSLLYLLVLYCLARSVTSARPRAWQAAAVAACMLGAAAKEVIATAPVVALLYDRALAAGSFRRALRRRWAMYLGLAASWGVLAALMIPLGGRGGTAGFMLPVTPWTYAAGQLKVVCHYLALVFWPGPLCLDYGWSVPTEPGELLGPAVIIACLATASAWALWRRPGWGLLGASFFLILAPTSSFVPLADIAFEHRMYLPLAPLVAAVTFGAYLALHRLIRPGVAKGVLAALLVALAAAIGARTCFRNADYRSTLVLWTQTVRVRPENPRAHLSLGSELLNLNRPQEGMRQFDAAIALWEPYAEAYNGRGQANNMLERYDRAIADCTRSIQITAANPKAHNNRALAHLGLHQWQAALADCDAAIRINPHYAKAHYNRGVAHWRMGEPAQALADFSHAIELQNDYANAYYGRALAYQQLGRPAPALADMQAYQRLGGAPKPGLIEQLRQAINGPTSLPVDSAPADH